MVLGEFRLKAGLDFAYIFNGMYNQDNVKVYPAVEASYNFAKGRFMPFASISSHVIDGSCEALSRRNPYSYGSGPTGWVNDLRLGFSGDVNDIFTYKLSGGVSLLDNYQIFFARQDISVDGNDAYFSPVTFSPEGVTGEYYTVGAEFGLHNLGGFSARLSADVNHFNLAPDSEMAGDLPKFNVGLESAYNHKDIFKVWAGVDLIGRRDYYTDYIGLTQDLYYVKNSIGTVVDVSVGGEVKVAHDFWIFLEGNNLANQRLYPYNHYAGHGINVMIGIKANF
jgi:hypothetical protein